MTRFCELSLDAQEKIRSLPWELKELYLTAKDVARAYENGYMAGDFTQLVFWRRFVDAIAVVEGTDSDEVGR